MNKKIWIKSIIYILIIFLASKFTAYAVSSNKMISYVDEEVKEDKILLNNVNESNYNMMPFFSETYDNIISNYQTELIKASMMYIPITVWVADNTKIYSEMEEINEIGNVLKGEKLQIELINNTWAKIIDTNNYIQLDKISYEKIERNLNCGRIVAQTINFRTEPSDTAEIQMILTSGTLVIVKDYNDDGWDYVLVDGVYGWVREELLVDTEITNISLGEFKITHYCNCSICCGKYAGKGITATGAKVEAGKTIAVDPSVIPYGTEVIINGHTYIAQDCGGGINGNQIDIYVETHEEAKQLGTYTTEVLKVIN